MFGLGLAPPDWQSLKHDWPNADASRFVPVGTLRWHVQIAGAEDAPPLLLLHGTGASSHSFRDLIPLLAETFRVIAPDLPGQGFTAVGHDQLSLPAMAEDIARLLEALQVAPVLAAGHSAGAAIAIEMALRGLIEPQRVVGINAALEPIRGDAIFSPMAKLLVLNPLVPRLATLRARLGGIDRFIRSATGSVIDAAGVHCYGALMQSSAHVAATFGMMAQWNLAPLQARLPTLQAPLTLIVAEDDPAVPSAGSRRAAQKAPHAEVIAFAEGGHLLHEVDPAAIGEIIGRRTVG